MQRNYDKLTMVMCMTIVFKVSDKLKEKMIKYYEDKRRSKTPPYAIFQAEDADTIVTLYESGKVMFQGISADIDAKMWSEMEEKLTGKKINISEPEKKKEKKNQETKQWQSKSTIGSDEVGTGDYFGPIVVTASYISKEQENFVEQLGVRDSKALTDEKIKEIAPVLMKNVPYCTYILNNKDYNKYQSIGYNMNKIKAILHNKVLVEMKKRCPNYEAIVVDQFVYPKKYFEHIKEAIEKVTKIDFTPKAESKCASVAASSCISRYIFLQKMEELSKEVNMPLLKGAGENVDKQAAKIVNDYGKEKLQEIAKLNFKNTEKLQQYL